MNKPLLLLMAPVTTRSGYGARSRDIALAIIESDKYDVKIWPTRWGATPLNALDKENEKDKLILDRILHQPQLNAQPDVFVQITVPNEFQRLGRYNIGITAGIETTLAAGSWIEGCNRMDLVLTSSEHAKKVFEESIWQKINQQTNMQEGELKLEKPVEVLFEGVNLEKYNKLETVTGLDELNTIPEKFCYLYVGHWLPGDFGEDRKNTSLLIRVFLEAFKNKSPMNRPALILKTSAADFSPLDKEAILQKIKAIYKATPGKDLPNVYLLHGDLTDEEMNKLYNHHKVKVHVSLTKGEGFGRPLAEAALSQKPVIAPNWSGHLDFLKHSVLLPGNLTNVHPSAAVQDILLQESKWFSVDPGYAVGVLKHIYDNYKDYQINAKKQATLIRKEFSYDQMKEKLINILQERVPAQVPLKLPQLKKIELPKLKKIEQ